ncbi:MAG TPA: aminopeptidase, partial [Polyangia bacterium]|nr:aminopeptidase [Polyangia bacterium]
MTSRSHQCRCAQGVSRGDALPFALPGSRATFTPARDVDVRHLRIQVALDFATGSVDGVCTLTLAAINDGPARVTLDAVEMELAAVELPGGGLPYVYDGQQLRFELGARTAGETLDVTIRYRCTPRRGLYFIRPDAGYPTRPLQAWSQGQDEDNRAWFPCFD